MSGLPVAVVGVSTALADDVSLSDGALRAYIQLTGQAQRTGSGTLELHIDQLGKLLRVDRSEAARRVRELEDRGLLAVRRWVKGDQVAWYLVRDPASPV